MRQQQNMLVDICVGRKVVEVAKHLKFSLDWTRQQLNYAGMAEVIGEGSKLLTPPGMGSKLSTPAGKSGEKGVDHAVSRVVKDHQ